MAGAYCKFCDHRCFVLRTVPAGPHAGWHGHMATCPLGAIYDRATLGYDHTTAINPFAPGHRDQGPLADAMVEPNGCPPGRFTPDERRRMRGGQDDADEGPF